MKLADSLAARDIPISALQSAIRYAANSMLGNATLTMNMMYEAYAARFADGISTHGLSDLLEFSRLGSGSRFNPYGQIKQITSNTPRFDFKANTLSPVGLLIEQQATNLYVNGPLTTGSRVVVSTATGLISPDAETAAYEIRETTESGEHYIRDRSIAVTAGKTYAFSAFIKALPSGRDTQIYLRTAGSGNNWTIRFHPRTESFSVPSQITGSFERLLDGWYLVRLRFVAAETNTTIFRVQLLNDAGVSGYVGSPDAGLYYWNSQVEEGMGTSFIPTPSSSVVRSNEYANLLIKDWFNPLAWTIILDHDVPTGRPLLASGANDLLTSGGPGRSILSGDPTNIYRSNLGAAYDTVANPGISAPFKLLRNGADTVWANAHVSRILAFPRKLTVAEAMAA